MAYVWLDNLLELEGEPATPTNMTWDGILDYVNGGAYPASTNNGYLQNGSGDYVQYNISPYYKQKTTSYGLLLATSNYQGSNPPGRFLFRNTEDTSYQISWSGNLETMTFRIAIDYDNQKVQIVMVYDASIGIENTLLCQLRIDDETKKRKWYDFLINHIAPQYTWQSVPSISGKNGILLLSTIQSVYLNNGDPVNNALESYIDFIDDSKVAVLVEQEIDDLTKVTVKYIVPAGTYEYIKLVYKVGSAPTSVTDGTAVDILQAAKKVALSGIADGSTYFFKIFTDITESEPYEFTTVKPEPIMGNVFAPNFSTDGRDVLRYDPNKTIHIHHTDSGVIIADYDATCGALFDLVYLATPHYTLSNNELILSDADGGYFGWAYDVNGNLRFIPANCSLWFELDIYFSGSGTGWVDWHMFNGQDSQVVYWCWDTKYRFSTGIWYNCKVEATVANGIVTYCKYYVNDVIVYQEPVSFHMLWVDETNPIPCKYVTFKTTAPARIKNMKIYSEVQ